MRSRRIVKTQIVHVIKSNGARFQYAFDASIPPSKILYELNKNKKIFGREGVITRKDPDTGTEVDFPDPNSPWSWDSPDTIVDVGIEGPDKEFVTTARLKGPPVEAKTGS